MRSGIWQSRLPWLCAFAIAIALAWWAGGYDTAALTSSSERADALHRVASFLASFGAPEMSSEFLARCLALTLETLAIAILGTGLAIVGGLTLGLLSSRSVVVGDARRGRRLRIVVTECARIVQDILRGVPDIAWAILAIPMFGLSPLAGVVALGLNVSGILARVYSELIDSVPERALDPLRASGASRLQVFAYGILPHANAALLSFTLLRWECSVRNASILGIVGVGGLGSEISLRISYGEYPKVLTLLAFMLVLTAGSDLVSQFIRDRLRSERGDGSTRDGGWMSPRRQLRQRLGLALGLATLVAWAFWHVGAAFFVPLGIGSHLTFADRAAATSQLFGDLLNPDFSVFGAAWASAALPLSMAFLGTLAASAIAIPMAFTGSRLFQLHPQRFGCRVGGVAAQLGNRFLRLATSGTAILFRSVPDVVWAMLFVSFLRQGTLPGVAAIAVHTLGLQIRLYVESIDSQPTRRLEVVHAASGSRARTFAYGAAPGAAPEWAINGFFQFEYNVRNAIVLGWVGAGGLGEKSSEHFQFFRFEQAGTYLLVMILLAMLLDRLSRGLGLARTRLDR